MTTVKDRPSGVTLMAIVAAGAGIIDIAAGLGDIAIGGGSGRIAASGPAWTGS